MIKDIIYNSNILDGLFTQKDFEFLKETNNRQEEIEYAIKVADLKRDRIIEEIKRISIEEQSDKNIDQKALNKSVENAEKAFEGINYTIRNLNNILNQFNEIEKEILELVVKKESNSNIDLKETVNKIDNKIFLFKEKQKEIDKENKKYSVDIDNFLNNNDNNITKVVNKFEINPEHKTNIYNVYDIDLKDNLELKVSEKQRRVYLPYTKQEIQDFLTNYPDEYKSASDVIQQEFVADISIYNKHPVLARFREAYSLSRNKEMKSTIDSLKFAMDMMFRSDINPTIIAAVKSQKQLESYIECLENNKLENFKYFNIVFEVNPI